MKKDKRVFGKTLMGLVTIFFYLPILFMMVFSFNEGKSLTHFTGFSLRWYQTMLKSHDMMESLYVTIAIALIATLVSTIVGTITAIGLSNSKKIIRRIVTQINDFPLMNPDIVTAIGLMLLFITFKIEKGFMTMLLAHIAFCIPYVILSVNPKIRSLDPNLANAAMDLGATPTQALTKVIIPEIMPGIVSGALIAFTMSFDDFIISYFATGGGVKNLSIMVYTMSKRVNPSINAISTLVVVLITTALLILNILPIYREKHPKKPGHNKLMGIVAIVVVAVMACYTILNKTVMDKPYAGQTLHVYNWGEYTGENIIQDFEEETGAKVVMDNFDSNEQMYIKVANGESYDILVPSDYMIQRLIEEDLLMPLELNRIQTALDLYVDDVKDLKYDPNNQYSVPYFWGSVGIVYDTTKVSEEELEQQGWNIFLNEKYKGDIYLYDSERDSFMMALKALGYSMNTENENELQEAYQWLIQCVQTMEPEIVTDEIIDNMAQARKALGLVYSGDATYIMSENENMGYYEPKQGTNIWCDAMVIPKNAQNIDLAYEFINYVAQYEGAYDNSSYVGYSSSNEEVLNDLANGEFEGINAYLPRSGYNLDEQFEYNENTKKIISDLWSRIKIVASNS
ncbi:extracellular solute-binding protein [Floccifex sp.]|uniref:extracellular solute-binding protein n=1 Tax=Floccifex sp. TaxID=2815810 RepID=UPI003F0826C8